MARRSRQSDAPARDEPRHADQSRADVAELPRQDPVIPVSGSVDGLDENGHLVGWAWLRTESRVRRRLQVLADGVVVGETVADQPRPDLATANVGDGAHSFSHAIPPHLQRPGESVQFAIRDIETGQQVGGDRLVEFPQATAPVITPVLQGNLDHVTNDGWVTGWCWYPIAPERHVELAIIANGAEVGRTLAAEIRPDLERAGIGDGSYGFSFALPWEVLSRTGEVTISVRDVQSQQQVGHDVTARIGGLLQFEDRIYSLERHVKMLRTELDAFTRQVQGHDEARAARELFRTVASFFAELADSPASGLAGAGLRGAVTAFGDAHPEIALAIPARPEATILIGGRATPTSMYRCIAALQAAGADTIADIVVMDDGSHGGAAALLPTVVRNLRYHRVPSRGSAFASYADAARDARGATVVCFSGDVVPEPRAVELLVQTFAEELDAQIIGCRIARPDGSAEYVGDAFDSALHRKHVGRDEAADAPDFSYLRPVDVVDGRAFAVRRDVAIEWPSIYTTASYAAADMCIAARGAGRSVLYQPAARATLAADAIPQPLVDEADLERLRLRWQAAMPHPHAYVGHALVIDGQLPRPDHDAGSVLIVAFMAVLRKLGWHLTFCPADGAFDPASAAALERRGIALARPPRYGSITAFLNANADKIDLVIACRHMHAGMLVTRIRELAPRAKFVFIPIDLHFLREQREAALTRRKAPETTRAQELALVHGADATIVHSDYERDLLTREVAPEKVHLLRWVTETSPDATPFEQRAGICFVGSFLHGPNVDAVKSFVADVMPLLHAEAPDLVLHVIGSDPPPAVTALAGDSVVVHGWVVDLAAFYGGIRLSVAPLRFGAGFKGKIATSLAHGVPVVATPLALEGMGLKDGDGITAANTPAETAHAILSLYRNPAAWAAQSARALERCAALYAPAEARAVWTDLLRSLELPVS
jgi:glycosyltransferase involved in cell wall biosynthesis